MYTNKCSLFPIEHISDTAQRICRQKVIQEKNVIDFLETQVAKTRLIECFRLISFTSATFIVYRHQLLSNKHSKQHSDLK